MLQTIRENLQYYRQQNDLSQETLSAQCNYDKTYIGKIERGDTHPSVEAILRIAEALDLAPVDLLREPVSQEPESFSEQVEATAGQVGSLFVDVFDNSPSICFLTNNGGEILQLNQAAEKFLKANANDLIGKQISEIGYWGQSGIDPEIIEDLRELGVLGKKATRRVKTRYKGKERDLQVQVSYAEGTSGSDHFIIYQLFFVEETTNRTLIGDHFDILRS